MSLRLVTSGTAVALALLAGAFLFLDATTWALYAPDPAVGRAGGCLTAVEMLLGVSHPSAMRGAELLCAAALLLGTPAALLRVVYRRGRSRRHRAAAVSRALQPTGAVGA